MRPLSGALPVSRGAATGARPSKLTPLELKPWREAAKAFALNTDFDVVQHLAGKPKSLQEIIQVMKVQSAGKGTIQALGDKIILSKLLENLNVPQMPVLFAAYCFVNEEQAKALVREIEGHGDAGYDVVVKPTHLSSAVGCLIMSKDRWTKDGWNAPKLLDHMRTFLEKRAQDCESEALKTLVPGFIVQPRYRSEVEFSFPLEMRVITLWGKARIGIWWWGRNNEPKGRRTSWFVRRQKTPGALSADDVWEVAHEHHGDNRGFQVALDLFLAAMPAMSRAAEAIAVAVGAPFLRSDFFVGSSRWGIRLNEVAYCSGIDYRRLETASAQTEIVDDSPAIAQILQEGFALCSRKVPEEFLLKLGAKVASYQAADAKSPAMLVEAVPREARVTQLPEEEVKSMTQHRSRMMLVTAASCETQPANDLHYGASAGRPSYIRPPMMSHEVRPRYFAPPLRTSTGGPSPNAGVFLPNSQVWPPRVVPGTPTFAATAPKSTTFIIPTPVVPPTIVAPPTVTPQSVKPQSLRPQSLMPQMPMGLPTEQRLYHARSFLATSGMTGVPALAKSSESFVVSASRRPRG